MAYLIFSGDSLAMNGATYSKVPLIMSGKHAPVKFINSFIRSSMRSRRRVQSSTLQKAYTLCNFCSFLERDEFEIAKVESRDCVRDVDEMLHLVDDAQLERWRNRDEAQGVLPRVINAKLSVVFQFLIYCNRTEGFPHRIGDIADDIEAPVKIWRESRRSWHPTIASNLLYKGGRTKSRRKGVPNLDEMADAYARASEGRWDLASRDVLLLNIAEEVSLRLSEALSLRISQLPVSNEIAAAERSGRDITLRMVRKGGREHLVAFPVALIRQIFDYVHDVRPLYTGTTRGNVPDEFVFTSPRTGKSLSRQYMSRRLSGLFRDASDGRRLTYHRVRARFATITISNLLDIEVERAGSIEGIREENILLTAMEMMGQSHIESLRPYLQIELQARFAKRPTSTKD